MWEAAYEVWEEPEKILPLSPHSPNSPNSPNCPSSPHTPNPTPDTPHSMKRFQTCTIAALASGLIGGYLGAQISVLAHVAGCQNKNSATNALCQVRGFGASLWEGSIAGLWTGNILGAFFAGTFLSSSRQKSRQKYRLQPGVGSEVSEEKEPRISFTQLQSLVEDTGVSFGELTITQSDAVSLLRSLGLNQEAIDAVLAQLEFPPQLEES